MLHRTAFFSCLPYDPVDEVMAVGNSARSPGAVLQYPRPSCWCWWWCVRIRTVQRACTIQTRVFEPNRPSNRYTASYSSINESYSISGAGTSRASVVSGYRPFSLESLPSVFELWLVGASLDQTLLQVLGRHRDSFPVRLSSLPKVTSLATCVDASGRPS